MPLFVWVGIISYYTLSAGTSGHVLPIGMKLGHLNDGGGVKKGERGEKGEKGGREGSVTFAGAPERPLAAARWVQKVVHPISLLGS